MSSVSVPAFLKGGNTDKMGTTRGDSPPHGSVSAHSQNSIDSAVPSAIDSLFEGNGGDSTPLQESPEVTNQSAHYSPLRHQLRRELVFSAGIVACTAILYITRTSTGESSFSSSSSLATFHHILLFIETALCIVGLVYGASTTILQGLRQIRSTLLGPELAESLVLIVACAGQVALLFTDIDRLAHRSFYYGPPLLLLLVALARLLDRSIDEESRARIGIALRALAPYGRVFSPEQPNGVVLVDSTDIKEGDVVVVASGEYLPIDGEVLHGVAEVDERKFGGILRNKVKSFGQRVFAGSKILSGELHIKASAPQSASLAQRFLKGLDESLCADGRSDLVRNSNKMYCSALIFLALCSVLYWRDREFNLEILIDASIGVLSVGIAPRILPLIGRLHRIAITSWFSRGITVTSGKVISSIARVRQLVLDYGAIKSIADTKVSAFEILDERVDRASLVSVLLSLFGDSEGQFERSAFLLLRKQIQAPLLFSISDYREYPNRGLIGKVQGVDFSVGNEPFLIERGVQLQTSDLPQLSALQGCIYVAMNEEVVARFIIEQVPPEDLARSLRDVSIHHTRILLCGREATPDVDALASKMGIEKASVFGSLQESEYQEKLSSAPSSMWYSLFPPPVATSQLPELITCSAFDEVRWNERECAVTLYGNGVHGHQNVKILFDLIREARQIRLVKSSLFAFSLFLTALLLSASFFVLMPPVLTLLTGLAGFAIASLIAYMVIS